MRRRGARWGEAPSPVEAPGAAPLRAGARTTRFGRHRGAQLGLTAGACAGAALPVIVSTARGLSERVTPNGDRAIIATRAYDVFTSHTPLDGQYSASSVLLHQTIHSPGPMLYWLLAVPARIGPAALAVTMGAANAAAAVAIVLLARRRGGAGVMIAAAVAVALMSRSLVAETYHDIWNPAAGIMPLAALVFLGWSVAAGRWRLLPITFAVASFVAQCQLAFVAPVVVIVAIALGASVVLARHPASGGRRWPWLVGAAAVGAACWSLPLYDQVARSGNLGRIANVASISEPALGLSAGWHAVVRAVGIPPWWLEAPSTPFGRLADVRTAPGLGAAVSCGALLVFLIALAGLAIWRRRVELAAAALMGLGLCAGLGAVAAFTPTRPSLVTSLGYTMWWGSVAGVWVWLVAARALVSAWGALRFTQPRRRLAARLEGVGDAARARVGQSLPALTAAAGAAATLAAGGAVAAGQQPDQDRPEYQPIRQVIAGVAAALGSRDRRIRVAGAHSFTAFDFKAAIVYALRLRGLRPLYSNATARLGGFYESRGRAYDRTVSVWDAARSGPGAAIVRVSFLEPAGQHTITVTVSRPRSR